MGESIHFTGLIPISFQPLAFRLIFLNLHFSYAILLFWFIILDLLMVYFTKHVFRICYCVKNFGSTMISMIASCFFLFFFFPNWPSVSRGQWQVPDEVQERLQRSIYELLIRFYVQYSSWLCPFLGLICCHII